MKAITRPFARRFSHPMLAGLLLTAGVLLVVAAILDFASIPGVPGVVPGFFGVYAVMTGLLGILGYLVLYAVRYVSMLRDRTAPHAA